MPEFRPDVRTAEDIRAFAVKRSASIGGFAKELRPIVQKAIEHYGSGAWYDDIVKGASVLWLETYEQEYEKDNDPMALATFQRELEGTLHKTTRPENPPSDAQIDRVTDWVGVYTVNSATYFAHVAANMRNQHPNKVWLSLHDDHVRPAHRAASGQKVSLRAAFTVGGVRTHFPGEPVGPIENWINCVVGSTQVGGPGQSVLAGTRRTHTGTFIKISTADGHELTTTPNHPVLTTLGYVPADLLRPGDQVLASRPSITPQISDIPASAEEIYRSLSEAGIHQRVRGSRVDFHGDVPETEVEVVWTHGDLPLELGGKEREQILVGSKESASGLASVSHSLAPSTIPPLGDITGGRLAHRSIGGGGIRGSLLEGELLHADGVSLAATAHGKPELTNDSGQSNSADADFPRHLEHALSVGMAPTNIVEVDRYFGSHEVYNFQTSENYYTGNGIAVHNCRCLVKVEGGAMDPQEKDGAAVTADAAPVDEQAPPTPPSVTTPPVQDAQQYEPVEYEDDAPKIDDPIDIPIHGVAAPVGQVSGDGRRFTGFSSRNLPLPFWLLEGSAHGMAEQPIRAGRLDNLWLDPEDNLIKFEGMLQGGNPAAAAVIEGLAFGNLGSVSVDLGDLKVTMSENDTWNDMPVIDIEPEIAGLTAVGIGAFSQAYLAIGTWADEAACAECQDQQPHDEEADEPITDDEQQAIAASAWSDLTSFAPGTHDGPGWITNPEATERIRRYWTHGKGAAKIRWGISGDFNRCRKQLAKYVQNPEWLAGLCANMHKEAIGMWPGMEDGGRKAQGAAKAVTAAAIELAPAPRANLPHEFFEDPKLDRLTPLTITDDGRIFGHLASWGVCHVGMQGICTTPPRDENYEHFAVGVVDTDQGPVRTGHFVKGIGHVKDPYASAMTAAAFYDKSDAIFADVVIGNDAFGPWYSGALREGLDPATVREIKATATMSGDWRPVGGAHRLIGATLVGVPGYPIPRAAVTASAELGQLSLVGAGIVTRDNAAITAAGIITVDHLIGAIEEGVERVLAHQAYDAARPIIDDLDHEFAARQERELAAARAILEEA